MKTRALWKRGQITIIGGTYVRRNSAIIFLFGSFVLLALLGVPIAVCLCVAGFGTASVLGITPIAVVQNIFSMLNSYTLLAVPLFLIVGNVMEYGGITERLVNFSRTLVGHIRGGLATKEKYEHEHQLQACSRVEM